MGIKTSKNIKNCRRQENVLEEWSSILSSIEKITGFNKLNMMHWENSQAKQYIKNISYSYLSLSAFLYYQWAWGKKAVGLDASTTCRWSPPATDFKSLCQEHLAPPVNHKGKHFLWQKHQRQKSSNSKAHRVQDRCSFGLSTESLS